MVWSSQLNTLYALLTMYQLCSFWYGSHEGVVRGVLFFGRASWVPRGAWRGWGGWGGNDVDFLWFVHLKITACFVYFKISS